MFVPEGKTKIARRVRTTGQELWHAVRIYLQDTPLRLKHVSYIDAEGT
jgi:hypothetical protein